MIRRILPLVLICLARPSVAADVPAPELALGHRPGADFRLAPWSKVVETFRAVDSASDRVVVRELGRTTEDRPYLVAIVSSPATIARLDHYRALQRRVADPRLAGEGDAVLDSKPVILVTCSIHSDETASTFMAMELLHDLASKDDPATREILDNTILLLVPSANPDGVQIVHDWYEESKGTAWEGTGMPRLYHKYAGHDTNRDWFMLNLKETKLLTRLLYKEWFPTITYDVHQMGSRGARLFVPPFHDPVNPNIDPRISQGIALLGSHMAMDLASAGKRGVLTNAIYDNWWNGGNRTTPQRHNMVGLLTEAASVKLASPIFLSPGDLAGPSRGFSSHRLAVNFVDPWAGGWWRLRDIVDYELICARSVLTLAARYRAQFQANYRAMARDAIARGKAEPPFAWVVPADQHDPSAAARMVTILRETGIEARRARAPFVAGAVTHPAGSWIFDASQPYRAHLKDMMERQVYPPRFAADGTAETPYDVAGWTLPLQMGVRSVAVSERFDADAESVEGGSPEVDRSKGLDPSPGQSAVDYVFDLDGSNDGVILLNALLSRGIGVKRVDTEAESRARASAIGQQWNWEPAAASIAGRALVEATPEARLAIESALPRVATPVAVRTLPTPGRPHFPRWETISPRRIGVYRPWVPSMDEGWTRLVLEDHGFRYVPVRNEEIKVGRLRDRLDVLLIPSISAATIRDGFARDATAPPYVGGLGKEGKDALQAFVEEGGTVVGLEDACTYLIEELSLPVTNVLKGVAASRFYGPGSVIRAEVDRRDRLAVGMPEDVSVYFDRSLAFDVAIGAGATVAVRYAAKDPLESGWLLGAERIAGKAAVVSLPVGKGRVILFAFPPQHRGQTVGTFRLLFNALLQG